MAEVGDFSKLESDISDRCRSGHKLGHIHPRKNNTMEMNGILDPG